VKSVVSNLYWESFRTFFKIGMFTLGGGYAMIPLIEEEVVNRHQWVSKDEMLDLIAIAQSCPGVFAINISIFIGYKLRKTQGAIATALGTALPSFLIILAIAIFFHQFEDNKVIAAMFKGIRPAVVALIAVPTFNLGRRAQLKLAHHLDPDSVSTADMADGCVADMDYHLRRDWRVFIRESSFIVQSS